MASDPKLLKFLSAMKRGFKGTRPLKGNFLEVDLETGIKYCCPIGAAVYGLCPNEVSLWGDPKRNSSYAMHTVFMATLGLDVHQYYIKHPISEKIMNITGVIEDLNDNARWSRRQIWLWLRKEIKANHFKSWQDFQE